MSENLDVIKSICQQASLPLINAASKGAKYSEFEIICSELKDWNLIDIRKSEEYKEMFYKLSNITGPAVYYFENLSSCQNKEIVDAITQYKEQPGSKAIPAIKDSWSDTTRILYVGKVKRALWGRVIQHMGYYKVNQTQGLQLFYWSKELCLDLKLHVYEFDEAMQDMVGIVEYKLAQTLKPLLGKHK